MKICPNCGRIYEDSLTVCDRCGWSEEQEYCRCGAVHETGAVYCSMCGKKIAQAEKSGICTCGMVNPPDARFCRQCGKQLAEEPAEFCRCGAFNPINAVYCRNCGKQLKKISCPTCGQIMNQGSVCAYCGHRAAPSMPPADVLPPVPKNPVGLVIGLWIGAFCLLSAICFFI